MNRAGNSHGAPIFAEIARNKIQPGEVKRVEPGLDGRIKKGNGMKRAGLLLMIGVVAALAALSVGAVAPAPAQKPSEIEELRKEVAALRRRVELLEQQHQFRVMPVNPQDGKVRPDVIDPYRGVRQVPPHWKEFEFNGMMYYIVPIDSARKASGEIEKQTSQNETPAASQAPDKQ